MRTSRCRRSSAACSRRTIPSASGSTRTSTTRSGPEREAAIESRVARRVLAGLDNARVAALIAADDLDLLVDLAGHTGHNRLPVFARRPARVALTWLDYVSTTGMSTIDYRVSDAIADPPGVAEAGHSERVLRLPVPAWCWSPPAAAQEPGPPPLARVGTPTFGSFNHAMKLTDATLALWRPLFASLPAARLVAVGVPAGSRAQARRRRARRRERAHRVRAAARRRRVPRHVRARRRGARPDAVLGRDDDARRAVAGGAGRDAARCLVVVALEREPPRRTRREGLDRARRRPLRRDRARPRRRRDAARGGARGPAQARARLADDRRARVRGPPRERVSRGVDAASRAGRCTGTTRRAC